MAKGNISVNSENIFPVIKKWLYSDKDIFLRELVSNSADAVAKLKKLAGIGEANVPSDEKYRIDIVIDKVAGTLSIEDNGIGMTKEEVEKYICDIAFSGAADFLEKYKDDGDKDTQIIGHFGLGFYSAFMPSESVTIETLSYKDGAEGVKWFCDGSMNYDIDKGEKETRGTKITLKIAEDSKEFLEEYTVRSVLSKYCSFMPVEIYLTVAGEEQKDGEGNVIPKMPVNDVNPLWTKAPKDCTDDDYKKFYQKVFMDFSEPLFYIHLNVDFPFNLKGILYFPKINHEFAANEGQIKLFNNQVFVADNVKEVIPEFLMLLKGVIDCPDLPLNVSRSFLQNDGYVKKISQHITKKVADKLKELYTKERDNYNHYWDDINVFIKYGCMRDEKFYDRVKDYIVYKDLDGKYLTLPQYLEGKDNKEVYYVSDEAMQSQYINMFRKDGQNAVILPAMLDTHFISFIEMKEEGVRFKRIDSAISENAAKDTEKNSEFNEKLISIFKEELGDETLKIEVQSLKDEETSAVILLSEESRRMQEMYRSYGQQFAAMGDMFKDELTLVLNSENPLIKKAAELSGEDRKMVCEHIYDLAMICHKPLSADRMTKFILRSNKILEKTL